MVAWFGRGWCDSSFLLVCCFLGCLIRLDLGCFRVIDIQAFWGVGFSGGSGYSGGDFLG